MRIAYFLIFICVIKAAYAADYYVTQAGAGDGSGSSEANAKAIASYSSSLAAPGDTVHFCGTFTQQITAVESGSDGSLYRMTGAGCSSPGIVDFSVSALGVSGDWSDQGSNVWRSTFSSTITVDSVWFNGKLGVYDATPDSFGEWTWAGNNLDVYATSNPASYYTSIVIPDDINWGISNDSTSEYDYLEIDGFTIRYVQGDRTSGVTGAIGLDGCVGCKVHDNTIEKVMRGITFLGTGTGTEAYDNTVTCWARSDYSQTLTAGITLYGTSGVTVGKPDHPNVLDGLCTLVTDATKKMGTGIVIRSQTSHTPQKFTIQDNEVSNTRTAGIYLAYEVAAGVVDLTGSSIKRNQLENGDLTDIDSDGIGVGGAASDADNHFKSLEITGNRIRLWSNGCIHLANGEGYDFNVSGNILTDCGQLTGGYGSIRCKNGARCNNNTIANQDFGIGGIVVDTQTVVGAVSEILNNIIKDVPSTGSAYAINCADAAYCTGGNNLINGATQKTRNFTNTGEVTSDPLFVDESSWPLGFLLQSGSPALNAGRSVSPYHNYLAGKCTGGTPDIGADCNDIIVPDGYTLKPKARARLH